MNKVISFTFLCVIKLIMVESTVKIAIKEKARGILADNCILKENWQTLFLLDDEEQFKLFQASIAKKQTVLHSTQGKGKPSVSTIDSNDPWINKVVDFKNNHVIVSLNGDIDSVTVSDFKYEVKFSDSPFRDNEYHLVVVDNLGTSINQPIQSLNNENLIVEQRPCNDNYYDGEIIEPIGMSNPNRIIEQRPINNNPPYIPKKFNK